MAHTVGPLIANLDSTSPGASTTVTLGVTNAPQPDNSVTGSVSVEFDGHTATAPLTVNFTETVVPAVSIDLTGAPNLAASVGEPTEIVPGEWHFPITITVV